MRARIAKAAIRAVLWLTGTTILYDGGYELHDWDVAGPDPIDDIEASGEAATSDQFTDILRKAYPADTIKQHFPIFDMLQRITKMEQDKLAWNNKKRAPPNFKIEYDAAQHLPDGAK